MSLVIVHRLLRCSLTGLILLGIAGCAKPKQYFSVILLPDTQKYSQYRGPGTYKKQTEWIVDNKNRKNIKFVIHLGDIVHHYNSLLEWAVAREAHLELDDNNIPYSVMPGNHDMDLRFSDGVRNTSMYNLYFGPTQLDYEGHYRGNDNNYSFFEASGFKFMVMCLEFSPRDDVINWANYNIESHPDRLVIIATHCYQTVGGGHKGACYDSNDESVMGGEHIWEAVVKPHRNVFMVVSGHINDTEHRIRQRCDLNFPPVHEILTDFQKEKQLNGLVPRFNRKFGNGWLKTLRFELESSLIYVETESVEGGNPSVFIGGEAEFYYRDEDGDTRYNLDPSSSDHQYSFKFYPNDYLPGPDYAGCGS